MKETEDNPHETPPGGWDGWRPYWHVPPHEVRVEIWRKGWDRSYVHNPFRPETDLMNINGLWWRSIGTGTIN